jgi:hypothetical protein
MRESTLIPKAYIPLIFLNGGTNWFAKSSSAVIPYLGGVRASCMRQFLRKSVTFLAIYTVALHAMLWGLVAPPTTTNAFDPLTVICHSDASAPAQQAPDRIPLAPAHICDQCNVCNAVALAVVPNTALIARFEPVRALQVLHAIIVARHNEIATDPKLARGPPAFA